MSEIIADHQEIFISTQVFNEFVNVMHKKLKISLDILEKAIDELSGNFLIGQVSIQTIKKALLICQKYQYAYFDSLVIALALEHGCSILYTEDMHRNQFIEKKLKLQNPFISTQKI